MNRRNRLKPILILLLMSFMSSLLYAQQLTFVINSSINYISINSYAGKVTPYAYALRFSYTGTNLNVPNWKIAARLVSPIYDNSGTLIFPPEKISFLVTSTSGSAQPNPIPTPLQIGIPNEVPFNGLLPSFLVPNANAPLYNQSQYNSYYELMINYDLKIEGGAYLQALQGGNTQNMFTIPVEFTAYGTNGEVIGQVVRNLRLDVFRMIDDPPVPDFLSLQVNGGARSGLLEVRTKSDYEAGASITYAGGLQINATTDYEVKVKSLQPSFQGASNQMLPLDIVNVQLFPIGNNTAHVFPIFLSPIFQVIAEGGSTGNQNVFFDIKYQTSPNDARLLNVKPEQYATTLQYDILAK